MDYEKKYKEAFERAKIWQKHLYEVGDKDYGDELNYIFPELKESEDERIRKSIICGMNALKEQGKETFATIPINDCIAWLEKQGEQKPANEEMIETIRTEYEKGRADAIAETQKDWSKEDEERIKNIISVLDWDGAIGKKGNPYQKEIDWLKSLKDRYTWKPSDEQMKAIHDLNLTGNISYAGQGQVLVELYNDLKNLKEE